MKRSGFKNKPRKPLKRTPFKRPTTRKTKRKGTQKPKQVSENVAKLKKRLDTVFSLYIRNKYAVNGLVKCFTCGILLPIKQIQNGHYVSRSHNSLRFSERNCHPQCVGCNVFRHGNMDEYAIALVKKYGEGILKELSDEKRKIKQFTKDELKTLIEHYNSQF